MKLLASQEVTTSRNPFTSSPQLVTSTTILTDPCGGNLSYCEWKSIRSLDCVAAVGDTDFQCQPGWSQVLQSYKLVNNELPWFDAKDCCEDLGGHLFYKVDGSLQQLRFLRQKMGAAFLTGIWTNDHVTWQGLDDETIPTDKLAWGMGEPNGNVNPYYKEQILVASGGGLYDYNVDKKMTFICDMM